MERHHILQQHQKFKAEKKEDRYKCDLTFKFYVKNIALLMLLGLLTQILVLLSEERLA
jgi:hypothetical protein